MDFGNRGGGNDEACDRDNWGVAKGQMVPILVRRRSMAVGRG